MWNSLKLSSFDIRLITHLRVRVERTERENVSSERERDERETWERWEQREREGATHPQLEEKRSGDSESERGAARVRV
jgi:hypothetical protein